LPAPASVGGVSGRSGNGERLAAPEVPGVRWPLAWSVETATLGRQLNDAQVVAIGARMHTLEEATEIVEAFLSTPFSGEPRHQRRIDLLTEFERTGVPPALPPDQIPAPTSTT